MQHTLKIMIRLALAVCCLWKRIFRSLRGHISQNLIRQKLTHIIQDCWSIYFVVISPYLEVP
jgi:hypothetical protein